MTTQAQEQLKSLELQEAAQFDGNWASLSPKERRRMRVLQGRLKMQKELDTPDTVVGDVIITQFGRERRIFNSKIEYICKFRKRMKGYANPTKYQTPDGKPNTGKKGKSML